MEIVVLVFDVATSGEVRGARALEPHPGIEQDVVACIVRVTERIAFQAVDAGSVTLRVGLELSKREVDAGPPRRTLPNP